MNKPEDQYKKYYTIYGKEYFLYTRRLGAIHLVDNSDTAKMTSTTICGVPLLSRNYISLVKFKEEMLCEECLQKIKEK